ncbi:MAG: YraN family protein [Bacteroidales bacterium]|jgi:putative endonuclease|nr:YraN family protein [Bacteroidales bacterium]
MAIHNQTGKEGELRAKTYLETNGYTVLQVNWQCGHYEVDIIAQQGNILVFCEVKCRTSSSFGEPEIFVTKQKQKNIIKAAESYSKYKQWQGEIRFDIISVLLNNKEVKINHIPDAFGCVW